MSEKKNGGPAYPGDEKVTDTFIGEFTGKEYKHETWKYQSGMSLRDWFAGMAMQSLVLGNDWNSDKIAAVAYLIADSMLKERED